MRTQFALLNIVVLLTTSVATALTCEKHFGLRVSKQLGIGYEASPFYLNHEALATEVLEAKKKQDFGPNSIWYSFMNDPRYVGPQSQAESVLQAAKSIDHSQQTAVDVSYYRFLKGLRERNEGYLRYEAPALFVTWSNLGIRAVNQMISERIGPVRMDNRKAFEGDLQRAHSTDLLTSNHTRTLWGKDDFSAQHFAAFRYNQVVERLSEHERVLFDLGYYLFYHEIIGGHFFGYSISRLGAKPTLKQVQEAYQNLEPGNLIFDFKSGLSVHLKSSQFQREDRKSLIHRFSDPTDLFNLLPTSVQEKMAAEPKEKSKSIIADFLNEVLTKFFEHHYRITLSLQKLTDPKP